MFPLNTDNGEQMLNSESGFYLADVVFLTFYEHSVIMGPEVNSPGVGLARTPESNASVERSTNKLDRNTDFRWD